MAVEAYIEDILESTEPIFRSILSRIVGNSEQNAKIEMVRQYSTADKVLIQAVKSILEDLKREERWFSRLLYKYFKIEFPKNKRRTQLIILGAELKVQYQTITKEKQRVAFHHETLLNSINNLRELSSVLHNKRIFLSSKPKRNKSDALIKKIHQRMDNMMQYDTPLHQKLHKLEDTEKLYANLFKQIPRYYELHEESYLAQLPSLQKV